ncbi:MAG: hypothetical protein IJP72_01190 [Bacteroidales bacterium]|nr:hypothetical protein [Bacteroidales bacterium]
MKTFKLISIACFVVVVFFAAISCEKDPIPQPSSDPLTPSAPSFDYRSRVGVYYCIWENVIIPEYTQTTIVTLSTVEESDSVLRFAFSNHFQSPEWNCDVLVHPDGTFNNITPMVNDRRLDGTFFLENPDSMYFVVRSHIWGSGGGEWGHSWWECTKISDSIPTINEN